jgi:hypothetical protein
MKQYVEWGVMMCTQLYLSTKKSGVSNNGRSNCVPVDDQYIVTHTIGERNFGNNIHTRIAKLQRNHGYVRFRPFKRTRQSTLR